MKAHVGGRRFYRRAEFDTPFDNIPSQQINTLLNLPSLFITKNSKIYFILERSSSTILRS